VHRSLPPGRRRNRADRGSPVTKDVTETPPETRRGAAWFSEAVEFIALPEVSPAAMFDSNGLRCRDTFFAFVGRGGDLIVNLPAAAAGVPTCSRGASEVDTKRCKLPATESNLMCRDPLP
jgi:hypothetical protein